MKASGLLWLSAAVSLACQSAPLGPEQQETPQLLRNNDTQQIVIEMKAGRIKYAAYGGGHEWRATFEVRVLQDSLIDISDQCEINFLWKLSHTSPSPDEAGWMSADNLYPHALMSIDGHWLDRQPRTDAPFWMLARVACPSLNSIVYVAGECRFLESVEKPDSVWSSTRDLGYGLADRVIGRFIAK